ncbi:MAG: hypothetical protein P8R46_10815 [Planctomycetota bacterium]|nr:hypothetical protein [Planctomycetota bacterium]
MKRLTVLTFVLWALVPSGLSLYFRLRLLPGEQWGLGLLFMILLPVWLASGLMFAFVRATTSRPRERVVGVLLLCTVFGLAAFLGTTRLSSLHFLRGPVERAFLRMDPPSQGATVLEIESDRNPTGFGRFVQEDPRRSTADRAALPTRVGGGGWGRDAGAATPVSADRHPARDRDDHRLARSGRLVVSLHRPLTARAPGRRRPGPRAPIRRHGLDGGQSNPWTGAALVSRDG